ncbi:LysE family translocator [Sedimenticola hydrogenitrophicus]|uniref:LysE family translocator n=1 Tax=Sedimenticola hydrogenitrophicus TaxID=2967975 RepID=UPI0023AEE0F4|nr:LysE family transporter [Sedimenticola hydrogenitrophicus]
MFRYLCVLILGIAVGNAVYIAIAILGWTGIRDNPRIFSIIEVMGASYLLWIGWQLLKRKQEEIIPDISALRPPPAAKQLMLGLNSALLNPKNALFYMSLMTVILGSEVTFTQQLVCGLWMFMAVLVWDILLAALIGQPKIQRCLNKRIHIVERGAGVVLMSFGIGLFVESSSKP